MDTKTINDKKNQIYSLLEDFLDEYNRIDSTRIQSRCENDLELRRLSDIIASQENEAKQRMKRIQELEKEVQSKIKQNHEYETMINSLQEKLSVADEEKVEENKFNMVIIQANEMSQKDREIERLNKVIQGLKNKERNEQEQVPEKEPVQEQIEESSTIDEVMDAVETKLESAAEEETEEVVEEQTELSKDDSKDDSPVPEKENEDTEEDTVESGAEEESEEEVDRGALMIFSYHRKDYFMYQLDNPQKLYEKLENGTIGKEVGERRKNEKGKMKTFMYKN
tara:strand:- start:2904 stop:3746 length:843 start_codon:yes stop_codon:yes gene_type:complete